MRRTYNYTGGRGIASEDFEALQDQLDVLAAAWGKIGPFVVSGCAIVATGGTYTLQEGYICLNGKLVYVPGQQNISLATPTVLCAGPDLAEVVRPYSISGSNQAGLIRATALVVPEAAALPGEGLRLVPAGMRTLKEALLDAAGNAGMTRIEAWAGSTSGFFDPSGLGTGSMRGWAIANGQNGTPDLRARFLVGSNHQTGEYAMGATGGAETVTLTGPQSGLPAHSHTVVVPSSSSVSAGSGGGTVDQITGSTTEETSTSTPASAAEAHENRPPYYALAYLARIGTQNLYIVV